MPTFNLANQAPSTTAMLDCLADGAWHPVEAVLRAATGACILEERDKAHAEGKRLRARILAKKAARTGTPITDTNQDSKDAEELVATGARSLARNALHIASRRYVERDGDQARLHPDAAAQWRTIRGLTERRRSGRVFGGIPEDEGWLSAPLRRYDSLHFRTDIPLVLPELRKRLPQDATAAVEADGMYRVNGRNGDRLREITEAFLAEEGIETKHMKIERDMGRRELADLDPAFVRDLFAFYVPFAKKRLRRNQSSLMMQLGDEDEIESQIHEWICEAITKYDPLRKGKPIAFGAYFTRSLGTWVHDLGRKEFGRTASDTEKRQQRAIEKFQQENQRRPTTAELAELLDQDEQRVRRDQQSVANMRAIRESRSLTGSYVDDDYELPIASTDDPTDGFLAEEQESIITQALTAACGREPGENDRDNVLAWASMYLTTWGGKTKTEVAEILHVSSRNLNVHQAAAEDRMRAALTGALSSYGD